MIKLSRWQIGHGIFLINPRRLWQELWLAVIFITFFQLSECVVRDCRKIILKSLHCAWLPLPKYFDIVKLGWQVLLKYLMNMFYFFHCTKIVIWVVRWWKSNWKVCIVKCLHCLNISTLWGENINYSFYTKWLFYFVYSPIIISRQKNLDTASMQNEALSV